MFCVWSITVAIHSLMNDNMQIGNKKGASFDRSSGAVDEA